MVATQVLTHESELFLKVIFRWFWQYVKQAFLVLFAVLLAKSLVGTMCFLSPLWGTKPYYYLYA